ncbi:hypothetical protein [Pseudomonas gingeri]|nr:hypothetical protein [Pseudomonas gingeri]
MVEVEEEILKASENNHLTANEAAVECAPRFSEQLNQPLFNN